MPPPPSHDATIILNYLKDREGAIIFYTILAPPPPPQCPLPQTPQYLTILMPERGRHYVCRILAPPMPPPSHDATILHYLNGREGAPLFFAGFWRPPPPLPKTSQYLTILMTGRGGRQLQYPVRSKYIRILLLILWAGGGGAKN